MSNALNNSTKLRTVFFLEEAQFGFVPGTGVNNTAALQALINAAEAVRGTAVIGAVESSGFIEHTGITLGATAGLTFMGAGKFRTPLRLLGSAAAGTHGITIAAGVDAADIHIMDIGLDGRYPSITSGNGIYLPNDTTLSYGRGVKLTRVYITKFGGHGLYVGSNRNNGVSFELEVSRCEDLIYIDNSSDWRFEVPQLGYPRRFNVNIPGAGADNSFLGGSMWNSEEAAVNLGTTGSSPNSFIRCTFDHHQKNAIRITGSPGGNQPHLFEGCWFRENSQAGDGLHAQILLTNTGGANFVGNTFTDQEGNPRPSYVVEFAGTNAAVNWTGNTVEADCYATAYTNNELLLITEARTLRSAGYTTLGGLGTAFSLAVVAGVSGGNYVQVAGKASGSPPEINAAGVDTNVNLRLVSKGSGTVDAYANGFRVSRAVGVASAVNYADVYNSATGNPVQFAAGGTDTNIDLKLVPKGTGVVQFGTHAAIGAETVTGYIEIKDAWGTVRKVAIVS